MREELACPIGSSLVACRISKNGVLGGIVMSHSGWWVWEVELGQRALPMGFCHMQSELVLSAYILEPVNAEKLAGNADQRQKSRREEGKVLG